MTTSIYMPAEWAPQSYVMLTWPHGDTDWATTLEAIDTYYVKLATTIAHTTPCLIICHDAALRAHVETRLPGNSPHPFTLLTIASDDTWTRDHGPICLLDEKRHLLDFTFNAWGKGFACDADNAINRHLWETQLLDNTDYLAHSLVLEGGGIDSDGEGTIITTARCLFNPNRNPTLSEANIRQQLQQALHAKRVIVIQQGYLVGDDTDGHVDTLVRFLNPTTLAFSSCDNPDDEHFDDLQALKAELSELRDLNDKPYDLVELPIPQAIYSASGQRLPANYCNFLITNDQVIVPSYADPADEIAVVRLSQAFPKHQITLLDARLLVTQGGSIHCATMNIPQLRVFSNN